ncbi:hypothetical protein TNCV_3313491 [Trichonephila clavipes]|nr:hypothetical protein TNCV_3313491 [Trichonephila clavipes]
MAYHIQAGNRRSSEGTRASRFSEQSDVLCPVVLIQMHEQNHTLHNHSPNVKVLVLGLAKAARQSNGTVTQRICCHLARLKDWNPNAFSPAGGKAMLLPNSVEQKKNVRVRELGSR